MKKIIYTSAVALLTLVGHTQDIHFSQYSESVMNVSPALAGTANGYLRANMNYRSQWSAFGKSYQTMGFSADSPFTSKKKKQGSYLGGGINVFNDKSGSAKLSTLRLAGDLNAILAINQSTISLGFEVAYVQRSIRGAGLKWDNQWDGTQYNSSLPSGETESAAKAAMDFGAGMAYVLRRKPSTISSNDAFELIISSGAYHFTKPNLGLGGSDPLNIRWTGMIYSTIGITNSNLRLSPRVLYNQQGGLKEVNGGVVFYYVLKNASNFTGYNVESAFGLGASYRLGDAIIPEIHFYHGDFYCGVSYDINISSLTPYSAARGGLEVTLRFTDVAGRLFGAQTVGARKF